MTDKISNEKYLESAVRRAKEKKIILPTFEQMQKPELIPDKIKDKLKKVGLWDLHPLNLFRISWKNKPKTSGGLFGNVNYLKIPKEITGVDAQYRVVTGKVVFHRHA